MKKFLILALLFTYGCKTYDSQLIANEYKYDTSRLSENFHIYENKPDELTLSRLKTKPYHIVLEKQISSTDTNNPIFSLISVGTLFTSTLVGIPSFAPTATCKMKASIFSENNNLIKIIDAEAQDREFAAMYYGYRDKDAIKTAIDIACYKARNEVYRQLEEVSLTEINNLNQKDKDERMSIEREEKASLARLAKKSGGKPWCKYRGFVELMQKNNGALPKNCIFEIPSLLIVLQQTSDGTLVDVLGDSRFVYLITKNSTDSSLVDGIVIPEGVFMNIGSYSYISTLGARKTVYKLRRIE